MARPLKISRFYVSIVHAPLISIQLSEDQKKIYKDYFVNLFGVKFIESEYQADNGIWHYDFESSDDVAIIAEVLKKMINSRVVKEIDINLNLN